MSSQSIDMAWKIIKSSSPDEAIDIIISSPDAIGDETVEAIKKIAEGDWIAAQQRMIQALRLIERVRKLITALATVNDMKSLAELARAHRLFWTSRLEKLTMSFSSHASQNGEKVFANALSKAMDIRNKALRLTNDLNTVKKSARSGSDYVEAIKARPELFEYSFLSWLGAIAHRTRILESDREKADAHQRTIEHLEYIGRIVKFQKMPFARVEGNPKMAAIRIPVPPGNTEGWFLDPALTSTFDKYLEMIQNNSLSTKLVAMVVQDVVSRLGMPPSDSAKSSQFVHTSAAFLRYTIYKADSHSNIPRTLSALFLFRELLNNEHMARLFGAERLSYVLRYVMAFLPNHTFMDDPRTALKDALQLLDAARPQVDGDENPGLLRDILFFRARIRRELCRWDPSLLAGAIADFKEGLEVEGMKYDREPRGRALGDYASALAAAPAEGRPSEEYIISLYLEAESLLDEFSVSRVIVILNLAIFYNERKEGVRSAEQEKALFWINHANDILESEELAEQRLHVYYKQIAAVVQLTKGNILRAISHGDPEECRRISIDSYHNALRALPSSGLQSLRGEIRLNLGYAHLEGLPAPGEAEKAVQQLNEAVSLLYERSEAHGLAIIARAEAWISMADDSMADWAYHVREVKNIRRHFRRIRNEIVFAKACWRLAELQLLRTPRSASRLRLTSAYLTAAGIAFEASGDRMGAVAALRKMADVEVERALMTPSRQSNHFKSARSAVIKAIAHATNLWERSSSIGWRVSLSDRKAELYARVLWLDANLGVPTETLWETARTAKANEFLRHTAEVNLGVRAMSILGKGEEDANYDRRLARMFEAELIRAQTDTPPTADLAIFFEESRAAQEEYQESLTAVELSMHGGAADSVTPKYPPVAPHPGSVICDITVSKWGTVVLWLGKGLPPTGVSITLAIKTNNVKELLLGGEGVVGWLKAYEDRKHKQDAWIDSTRNLIGFFDKNLWDPCLDFVGESLNDAHLYIVPGVLSGIPIHAGSPKGKLLIHRVNALAWLPSLDLVKAASVDTVKISTALCVLSDPSGKDSKPLRNAPSEISRISSLLNDAGVDVTLLASVDADVGQKVFTSRAIPLLGSMHTLERRPTPAWIQEHLHEFDLFFYSGHGYSKGASEAGLLLMDDAGKEKPLRLLDLISAPVLVRQPIVVLSACETAHEGLSNPGEQFSIVSAFLRLGARSVIGTLWVVRDDVAAQFSEAYCVETLEKKSPGMAFVKALRVIHGVYRDDPTQWSTFCHWLGRA